MRAFYFGFAAMIWLVSPNYFFAFIVIILRVLRRRDFHSRALRVRSD